MENMDEMVKESSFIKEYKVLKEENEGKFKETYFRSKMPMMSERDSVLRQI